MKRPALLLHSCAAIGGALAVACSAGADTIGIVADNGSKTVVIFDADSGAVAGSIPIPGILVGDCLISPGRNLGFVTDFNYGVWVIDLSGAVPCLAAGVNPIPISNAGEDLALSADERFLLVTGGLSVEPVSVIDLDLMAEVTSFATGSNSNSVDVTEDGSVLVTSMGARRVTRYMLDGAGGLSPTGAGSSLSSPNNAYSAPGGMSAVVVSRSTRAVTSYMLPYLVGPQTRSLAGQGLCATFSAAGSVLYVRTRLPAMVQAFEFDPGAGTIAGAPFLSFPVGDAPLLFGVDQMVMHPGGNLLLVPEAGGVAVYDAATGVLVDTLTDPMIQSPMGIALATIDRAPANMPPLLTRLEPLVLRAPNGWLKDISGAFDVEDSDGDAVSLSFRMLANEPDRGRPDFVDRSDDGGDLLVRSERAGAGSGRFYILVVTADDGRGGIAEMAVVAAVVPHDQSRRSCRMIMQAALAAEAEAQAMLDAGMTGGPSGLFVIGE